MLRETLDDTRLALRFPRLNKAFASIAILTMAIGIGATTAIFKTVVLDPLF